LCFLFVPLRVLQRTPCPQLVDLELTRQPSAANAAVNCARLLHVHRNGEVASPRVSGSTRRSNAAVTPG
jgi:hypothetical protein